MRLYLAQINTTVGDFSGNVARALAACEDAHARNCDVVLLPEMTTTGYPPRDLLFLDDFLRCSEEAVQQVAVASVRWKDLSVFLGCVERTAGGLRNSAAIIKDGQVRGYAAKTLLPTYDVFDELRYFKPTTSWVLPSWKGVKLGLTICEDLWDEGYETKVVSKLVGMGARAIINLSASPFHAGKWQERRELMRRHAIQTGVPLAYCNLVGAESELVFDGGSLVVEFDVDRGDFSGEAAAASLSFEEEVFSALVLGTRDFHHKQGFQKCVLGLSGGVDSSLVAVVAAHALGAQNVMGVTMPSRVSTLESVEDARTLARNLGISFHEIPIEESVKLAEERYGRLFGLYAHPETRENLQARERGKILMEISNDQQRLLLTTGNKTEYALGYATLYGDMCGALAVIGDLNKAEVYSVCRWVNARFGNPIPARVLNKKPSAELAPGQVDPFDYSIVSPLVDALVEEQASPQELIRRGFPDEEVRRCVRLLYGSEHKRWQAAPALKVSRRAFGRGRKMPLVNKYIPE